MCIWLTMSGTSTSTRGTWLDKRVSEWRERKRMGSLLSSENSHWSFVPRIVSKESVLLGHVVILKRRKKGCDLWGMTSINCTRIDEQWEEVIVTRKEWRRLSSCPRNEKRSRGMTFGSVSRCELWMTLGQCRLFWKGVNFIVVQSHKEWARLVKGQRIKEELFHKMHLT